MRTPALVVLLAALLAIAAAPAHALTPPAPPWTSPVQVDSGDRGGDGPQIAADGDGNVTAAWSRLAQIGPLSWDVQIRAAHAPAGGAFGSPATLGTPAPSSRLLALATGSTGVSAIVWQDAQQLYAATAEKGADFGPPTALTPTGRNVAADVSVAPTGEVVAAFGIGPSNSSHIEVSVRPPGGSFGASVPVPGSDGANSFVRLRGDGEGDVVLAWNVLGYSGPSTIHVATRPAGGVFSPQRTIVTSERQLEAISLARAANGDTLLAYNDGRTRVLVGDGTTFGPPADLGPSGFGVPDVAVGARGDAVAIWRASLDGKLPRPVASYRPAGAAFGVPEQVGDCTGSSQTALVDDAGNAMVVVEQGTSVGAGGDWWSARTPSGPWSAPSRLGDDGASAGRSLLTLGGDGIVTAIWSRSTPVPTPPYSTWSVTSAHTTLTLAQTAQGAPQDPPPAPPPSCDVEYPTKPKPLPAPIQGAPPLRSAARTVTLDRRGSVKVSVRCASRVTACSGWVRLSLAGASLRADVTVAPSQTRTLTFALPSAARRWARKSRSRRGVLTLVTRLGADRTSVRSELVVRAPARRG